MNDGKFKVWFGILVIVIVIILLYRVLTVETKNAETLKAITATKQATEGELLMSENKDHQNAQEEPSEPQLSEKELSTVLQQLQPHQFHEDPYIEAKLLFELKSACKRNKRQLCEGVLSRYQTLEPLIKNYADVKKVPAMTELGQMLKHGMASRSEQPEVFRHKARKLLKLVLNSDNAYVISYESLYFLFSGDAHGEIIPISQWLRSQDSEYNRMVLMYSLLKIAHGFEPAVIDGESDFVVSMICNWRDSVCGLSFDDYFQKELMPGMQKDVDLLVTHLRAFANEH